MSKNPKIVPILLLAGITALVSCGRTAERGGPAAGEGPPDGQETGPPVVPPPPGSGTGPGTLTWTVPEGWVEETPSSPMRRAQYRVPGAGEEGEFLVLRFDLGQGGGPAAKPDPGIGQFRQPDGRPSSEVMKTSEFEVSGFPVLLVELTGTYTTGGPMTGKPEEEKPGYMLLGAMVRGPGANWFFRLTGPEATVRSQRENFEKMIRSLNRGD